MIKKFLQLICLGGIFLFFAVVFYPSRFTGNIVSRFLTDTLKAQGILVGIEAPRASLRNFKADEFIVRAKEMPYPLRFKDFELKLDLLAMLSLRTQATMEALFAKGAVESLVKAPVQDLEQAELSFSVEDISLKEIAYLSSFGVSDGKATAQLSFDLQNQYDMLPTGEISLTGGATSGPYFLKKELSGLLDDIRIPKLENFQCQLSSQREGAVYTARAEACQSNLFLFDRLDWKQDSSKALSQLEAQLKLTPLGRESFGPIISLVSVGKVKNPELPFQLSLGLQAGRVSELRFEVLNEGAQPPLQSP